MRKITLFIFGLFALLLLVCSPAYAATNCPTVTKAEIAALFEQWDQSLQTGKPSEVAKNYADEAILVPTVSNKVRHTQPEIEDYFQRFLKLKPDGRIEEQNIQIYCDVAINSGIYAFAVVKDGQPSEVKARYTFVYHKVGDRWLIVDHHSSEMPEKTAKAA
ncbi:MAG: SgcJ/EcaC family oxidoreductase [Leptolyngbyaceae cyanobacterium CRU_2_3]|nr:SgcJ/EcaC family oxidoreductase [Acaryochloris sp. RU_4_1]NJR51338.1 SgcJ/EcaC family oxidoreductase [Leptolyngbyaceae cyanobacterium CSU_1_3]NJR64117.1 SgcJ/EcaC family oxidoreductase [Leptolyngbyaceae cyanobacterium CRU_2_3]